MRWHLGPAHAAHDGIDIIEQFLEDKEKATESAEEMKTDFIKSKKVIILEKAVTEENMNDNGSSFCREKDAVIERLVSEKHYYASEA